MSFDLVALGETMYTLSTVNREPLEGAECLQVSHAGAESNTCIGAARLGLSTAWVSRLGADPAGAYVRRAISAEGVNVDWVAEDPSRPTGLMLKDVASQRVHYYRSGSAASALAPVDLGPVPIAEARTVLVTGVTALISESASRAAIDFLKRARGVRIVDPNLRAGLWGSERSTELITPLIARADIVIGGERELSALFGGQTLLETLRNTIDHGPSIAVAKRGPRGAVALHADDQRYEVAPPPTATVDSVGAGDAFNAGYIAASLLGRDPHECVHIAARCGAAVAGQLGDTAGALYRENVFHAV